MSPNVPQTLEAPLNIRNPRPKPSSSLAGRQKKALNSRILALQPDVEKPKTPLKMPYKMTEEQKIGALKKYLTYFGDSLL